MKNKFIKLCQKVASYSDHHQHKMAAVVIRKNKLISFGFNSLKTHTKSPHLWKSTHAEFSAIKGINKEQLEGASILVFREQRDGTMANARPCASCLKLIINSGIKKIYFTHKNGIQLLYI